MPLITLPDSSQRRLTESVTVYQLAKRLHPRLAEAALAGEVDGQLVDLSYLMSVDAKLRIITEQDPEGLVIIRHSSAHLLAQAVKQLFPTAQVAIGPVIEDGFYYDFSYERSFVPEDLVLIENRMLELVQQDLVWHRFLLPRLEALALFRQREERYKLELIEAIPADEAISLYQQGDFIDLCRGPHVPSTARLKAFKLMRVAGAYWRGDANNPMLQRIYGTAWASKKDLTSYLQRLQEVKKRDHRKLAKQLDLFHVQEEAPGMIFWHPLGWEVYQVIEQYIRRRWRACGYQEIRTPQILNRQFWEASGHWDKFFSDMFITCSEEREFAIKPMSCPGHVQIFNQSLRSHRDLPLRLAEFGFCHRNEPSGGLHGLMRVRSFVQDDAHIFCTEDQLQVEVTRFIELLYDVYADFGFDDVLLKLATRPLQRLGSDETWDRAEQALAQAITAKDLKWEYAVGEGAFYGPKLEFSLRDCLGRLWQCGTIQVDFSMPERLGASYVAEDGSRRRPVMLHRAILGSLERFIGILIEHYAAAFPVWLAPVQVVVMTITDRQADYARELAQSLQALALRVKLDLRNEKIGFKIREHSLRQVPYHLILGDHEQATKTVSMRQRGSTRSTNMPSAEFQQLIVAVAAQRG